MTLPVRTRHIAAGAALAFMLDMLSLALTPGDAVAQVMVYPARGQNPEQTQRDKGECMAWASQQSGFDPTAPRSSAPPPPSQAPTGAPLLGGATRGAAVGAVGGAIGGDAGKGAATGALIGGVRRREQAREQQYAQQPSAQQQSSQFNQQQGNFNRAYGACLQGRGYTVG